MLRLWLSVCVFAVGDAVRAQEDEFNRVVRPILSQYCFKCHGPDEKSRKGGLRLDLREAALRPARSGERAIVPGKPDESELIARITSDEEGLVMPPPSTKLTLSAEQRRILTDWIRRGAEYRPHWAFVGPTPPPVPPLPHGADAHNPIDHFIAARLRQAGLKPNPEADRATLIRRVSLDLIGLPPTREETHAFVNDPRPDAYERLVDRLLANPAYGERWARRWLDLARYADTNGYEKDRPRSIWPYRDWVIDALNRDMPFDQFTIEQLAGDMLPNPTPSQRIATGFHRNTMLNEEGGIDPLEFRFHAVNDRVATTGIVWLGLTTGCAQCHTHKYDPIRHHEYYQMFAFFNNADEPTMRVTSEATQAQRQELLDQKRRLEAGLAEKFPPEPPQGPNDHRSEAERRAAHLHRKFTAWRDGIARRTIRREEPKILAATANIPTLTVEADNSIFASGDFSKSDRYTIRLQPTLSGITAVYLEVLPDERLPMNGPGRVSYEGPLGDFFLSEIVIKADGKPVPILAADADFSFGRFTIDRAIDGDPQSGWSINGGQGKAHQAVFVIPQQGTIRELTIELLSERYYAAGIGKFRLSVTNDLRPPTLATLPRHLETLAGKADATAEETEALTRWFLSTAPELAAEHAKSAALDKQMPSEPTTLVMAERPAGQSRTTHVYNRGEFLQPTEVVQPGTFAFLNPFPADLPKNRLGFARWLVSPANPLTARVAVNRAWAAFFGSGIVRTLGDFGYQGETPSHPALLDWLATEFVREGWSMKKLHRRIVTSAAYRRSSAVTPEQGARDPENRLLARGPRVRLDAEMIRDGILAASGLLTQKLGGPSVFPPQPPNVTTEGAYGRLTWRVSTGPDRYRRGLYTFSKRTAPYAMFATFDAPSGEVCTARREVSNSPLQALTLLNDSVVIEAAQHLGKQMPAEQGPFDARLLILFERILTRSPTTAELDALRAFAEQQRRRLTAKQLNPDTIAGPGDGDPIERAVWTLLARALFNVDEFVVKN